MAMFTRRGLMESAAGLGVLLASAGAAKAASAALEQIDGAKLVSPQEALDWHRYKDLTGPTFAGSPSWRRFLDFLESRLQAAGCVDISRSPWRYQRLEITDWPDSSQWSLTSAGRKVKVSNYGANCGVTDAKGLTAPLVVWDPATKPDIAGKIVVFRPGVREDVRQSFGASDYEYLTPFESWPKPGRVVPQTLDGIASIAPVIWDQMTASAQFIRTAVEGRAAGIIFAMDMNAETTAGLYTFPVPEHYDIPSVYLDRSAGDAVIADAKAGKPATIKILGRYVDAEAYQLIAFLPGKDYGTAGDELVHLRTHTDGPSVCQDDGALGLLGVVSYMGRLPRPERPRSLFVELDCRHFMPGAERSWAKEDYFAKTPQARDKVVAMVAMEHLGNIEYVSVGEALKPSGRSNVTSVYATGNQKMIDYAYRAAQQNHLPSAAIRSPARPGSHGKSQGPWYGMGSACQYLGLPGFSAMADLGGYWQTSSRVERFDAQAFVRQVATFTQLTGFLMSADLAPLQAPKVPRPSGALG